MLSLSLMTMPCIYPCMCIRAAQRKTGSQSCEPKPSCECRRRDPRYKLQEQNCITNLQVNYNTSRTSNLPTTLSPNGQGSCLKAHYFPPGLEGQSGAQPSLTPSALFAPQAYISTLCQLPYMLSLQTNACICPLKPYRRYPCRLYYILRPMAMNYFILPCQVSPYYKAAYILQELLQLYPQPGSIIECFPPTN